MSYTLSMCVRSTKRGWWSDKERERERGVERMSKRANVLSVLFGVFKLL